MSGLAEYIYLGSPITAQQAIVAAYGWWWYHRRFGPNFHQLAAQFKAREYWTGEQFLAYQEQQLRKLFSRARQAPYYRKLFADLGVTHTSSSFETLLRLPLLSKDVLRTRSRELLTEPRRRGTLVFKTSGSTGTPTEIYYEPDFHALELAIPEARNLNWAGLTYRSKRVMFGVRKVCAYTQESPPFWRFSPAENMAYASIYHLSARFLDDYLEFLRIYRPDILMGYPSALTTIAAYARDKGQVPPQVKAIFTTSETVTEQARLLIEAVWRTRIFDRYGAVEGCVFASQCEFGRYHVSPEIGVVEILDGEGRPAPPGEIGEVVCTGLQNMLQPLIRYRIGDIARWALDQSCTCGRQMPILEGIEGRIEDMCYTPDGRAVLRFDTVFKGVNNIQEAQVVQEQLDSFTIYVLPTAKFNQHDIQTIEKNMKLHVGEVRTTVRCVSTIARTESGKFRAVLCNLPLDQRTRYKNNFSQ